MDYATTTSATQTSAVSLLFLDLIVLVFAVIAVIGIWKMFQKAGKPGWAAIVPFYGNYVQFEVGGYNGWLFLLMFIPIVSLVMYVLVALGIAKNFGRSVVFAIFGLILFPIVGYLILGFGKDKYLGGSFEPTAPAAPAAPVTPPAV